MGETPMLREENATTPAPGTESRDRAAGAAREAGVRAGTDRTGFNDAAPALRRMRSGSALHLQPRRALHRARRSRPAAARGDGPLSRRDARRRPRANPPAPLA